MKGCCEIAMNIKSFGWDNGHHCKVDFCPGCGTRLREPVECSGCRFYKPFPDDCVHPDNLIYTSVDGTARVAEKALPSELNANKDCKLFEPKDGGQTVSALIKTFKRIRDDEITMDRGAELSCMDLPRFQAMYYAYDSSEGLK